MVLPINSWIIFALQYSLLQFDFFKVRCSKCDYWCSYVELELSVPKSFEIWVRLDQKSLIIFCQAFITRLNLNKWFFKKGPAQLTLKLVQAFQNRCFRIGNAKRPFVDYWFCRDRRENCILIDRDPQLILSNKVCLILQFLYGCLVSCNFKNICCKFF